MTDGGYQSARRKNSTPGAGGTKASERAAAVVKTGGAGKGSASGAKAGGSKAPVKGRILTQHTGLPPRAGVKGR